MLENGRVGGDGGEAGISRVLRNGVSWFLAKVHDVDILHHKTAHISNDSLIKYKMEC
jgi:hypothetical protein